METQTRRITVTSSLNEVSTNQLESRVVVRGRKVFGQIFKDDVNFFSSTSDISFMHCTHPAINDAKKVGNFSPAIMGRGINSRNQVWN
jgi:hypothetical protein